MSKTYRLSSEGKRMGYVLLLGVASIEGFAIWSLSSLLQDGLAPVEWVPLVIMALLALAAPFLAWNILEELGSSLELNEKGLIFRSLGITLICPWSDVVSLDPKEEKSEEGDPEAAKILARRDLLSSGTNPVIGILHWQAHGRRSLPVYGSVQDRVELLQEVRKRAANDEVRSLDPGGTKMKAQPPQAKESI